jgi:hypothetical protein
MTKTFVRILFALSVLGLAACPTTVVRDNRQPPPPPPPGDPGPDKPPPVRPDPRPPAPPFDPTGWTLLGSQTIEGRVDRDVIPVGKAAKKFDRLVLVVLDSSMELLEFNITFGNKEKFSPPVKHVFNESSRTREIDLPGNNRIIASIELVYRNIPGGGRARVEIYGKNVANAPKADKDPGPPPPPEPGFDPAGWELLGTQTVDGKKDHDIFQVGKKAGKWDKVTLVVKDSDLELVDFIVTFGNNEKFEPKVRHVFKEGSRSRAIDLPGDNRKIKSIELKYANLPGGGKATVELYAKDTKAKPKKNK